MSICNNEICFTTFISKIPKWGWRFYIDGEMVTLENTCSFDYFVFGLWVSSKVSTNFLTALLANNSNDLGLKIEELINQIETKSWNEAKKFWLLDVCKMNPITQNIDCFGSVHEYFGRHVEELQLIYENKCTSFDCGNGRFIEGRYIELYKSEDIFFIDLCEDSFFCPKCGQFYRNESYFKSTPAFLIISTKATQNIFVQNVPKNIRINGESYRFLFCNYKSSSIHFKSVFFFNNNYYVVDDMKNKELKQEMPKKKIDTCFYYLE